MSLDPRMTPAEFRCLRQAIGLSRAQVAELLRVAERTVGRWEEATTPIPDGVAAELWRIVTHTGNVIDEIAGDYNEGLIDHVVVYRTDEDLWFARRSHSGWPASWWRVIAGRVAIMTGARVVYGDE